jgi:Leucine-rich repeat (LRR) protein
VGTLPESIGNLTQLITLNITDNRLSSGPLPSSLGTLRFMQTLALSRCYILGALPDSIAGLQNLTYFDIEANVLTGFLNSKVTCALTKLQYLSIANNYLTGPVPSCMGNLTHLNALDMGYNNFYGRIPESLGNLVQLRYLNLGYNDFTHSIPDALASLTKLKLLDISGNLLTGTFPEFVTTFTLLESFTVTVNYMVGTMPASIANLALLRQLEIEQNYFNGTLPASLSQLTALEELNIELNFFTGTLPAGITGMHNLQILFVAFNELSGTVPPALLSRDVLERVLMEENYFTGSLTVDITANARLDAFVAGRNFLTGTVPSSLVNARLLGFLELSENLFTGTIPSVETNDRSQLFFFSFSNNYLTGPFPTIAASSGQLAYINVSGNSLSGTLPASLGNLSSLDILYAYSNKFTSSLPDIWSDLTHLSFLLLGDNLLTGTIPASLGDVMLLQSLNLSSNFLTGTIPDALSRLTRLNVLLLMDNALTGRLDTVVDISRQQNLTTLQVSNNQLSGTLPEYLSQLPLLSVFAAVSNCFTGSIPESICASDSLHTLALDGLQAATSCQQRLFPAALEGTVVANSLYAIRSPLTGGVPSCLFEMGNLTTLHLSGNGLTGSIPSDVRLSPSLTDLSLSHNKLTGTIPAAVLGRDWSNLDLSYNRLTGSLKGNIEEHTSNSTSLYLANNRLSGVIPGSFAYVPTVDILQSNLFSCHADRNDLPANDPNEGRYDCASTNFDASVYAWLSVAATGLAAMVFLRVCSAQPTSTWATEVTKSVQGWLNGAGPDSPAYTAVTAMVERVLHVTALTTAYIVLILLPIYAVCTALYGTYTHQYAYTISAAYLSGTVPFAWEFVFLLLLIAGTCAIVAAVTRTASGEASSQQDDSQLTSQERRRSFAVYTLTALLNFVIVLGVNTAYVVIVLNRSGLALTFTQIALALFKVAFNSLCSPALLRWTSQRFAGRQPSPASFVTVQLLVSIVNNILVPCLVVSIISPDCFYNIFKTAAEVYAYFQYDGKCILFYTTYRQIVCLADEVVVAQTSYSPPFDYSYQCSSSFITYYAPAYVIMCIIAGFALPVAQVVLQRLHSRAYVGTRWFAVLDTVLPRILKPLQSAITREGDVVTVLRSVYAPVFDASQHLITLLSYLALLLTFGGMFPPLAVCFAITMMCMVLFTKLKVGRFLVNARETNQPGQVAIVEQECAGVGEPGILLRAVSMIAVSAGVFYTLFLFDTLGDQRGLSGAYWVLIVTPLMAPLGLVLAIRALHRGQADALSSHPSTTDERSTPRETEVELSTVSHAETLSPIVAAVIHA